MPLLCRFRSKPVSYLRAAFCLHREVTKLVVYWRPHVLLCCENGEGSPRTPTSADAHNTLSAAQSRQAHAVTQHGPSRVLVCISGQQFQGSQTATVTLGCALCCAKR